MPLTPWGDPYPLPTGAVATASDLMALAMSIGPGKVLKAVDAADRDTKWADPAKAPLGCVVTGTTAPRAVWLRVDDTGSPADWAQMWVEPTWVTTGFVVNTGSGGFNVGNWCKGQIIGNDAEIRFGVTSKGDKAFSATTDPNPGNIGDTLVLSVPAAFAPSPNSSSDEVPITMNVGGLAAGFGKLTAAGNLYLTSGIPGFTIADGQYLRGSVRYRIDNGAA